MCTVSVLRLPGDVLRVACNRDERLTRPAGLPPVVRRFGGRAAIMPVDPAAGGTWVAANDAGLVLALLNYNAPGARVDAGRVSRGRIIPALLHLGTVDAVTGQVRRDIEPGAFAPFRLIALQDGGGAELTSDGVVVSVRAPGGRDGAWLFASSGLGDHLVEGPRRRLFAEMLKRDGRTARTQDLFHSHRWPDRPHLSVNMCRPDARTVSKTVIEVRPGGVRMTYASVAPHGRAGPVHELSLDLAVSACG